MRHFDTTKQPRLEIDAALTARDDRTLATVEVTVRAIIADVRARGDDAVIDYVRRFEWPDATADSLEVPLAELVGAANRENLQGLAATEIAAKNIIAFHQAEMGHLRSWRQSTAPGQEFGQILQPVKRVGIYVPGGKAYYPSTLLMTAIPASVAGVSEIILCTPPRADGSIHPLILTLAGRHVDRVFRVGGAQAIAAMAYGTATVPPVDVIVGPGNDYVNTAKRMVYGTVGIDMLAGPSEVAVIADSAANPAYVAADLLAQTEHGPENRGVLFSPSANFLENCREELFTQRAKLSRQEILAQSDANLMFVKTRSLRESVELVNVLAPEHLELCVADPASLLGDIRNAGAILLGENTSAPAGDYVAGPSHTLPTAGAARFSSPLSCNTFIKRSSVLYHDVATASTLGPSIAAFADIEGFDAHASAARLRIKERDKT
jgi:histidinol dehydrogenase